MIQVIERAFRIMEELGLDGEVSLEALARCTQLNKGTLCNILRALIELGYVRRTREGHYQLTGKIRELAVDNGIPPEDLEKMRSAVSALAAATGESGVIGVLRRTQVAIAAQAQYQRSLMVNPREVYGGLSLFGSVTGRILVAFLSPEERETLCRQTGFPGPRWDNAETSEDMEKVCAVIRSRKLSVMENTETGIIAFAVPVPWRGRTVSLGLTMPLFRCPAAEKKRIPKLLREQADTLTAALSRE